jgi:hypothetical protein
VLELSTSIAQLKAEIIVEQTSAKLPPSLGFMTSSEFHYSQYNAKTLPENALFSAWILRNEITILSHKVSTDQILHFTFQTFKTMINHGFSQNIAIQQENFIQILVVDKSKLKFISFDADELFNVQLTSNVLLVNDLFKDIIQKESQFLEQITAFQTMLETSEIITTQAPIEKNVIPSLSKRSILDVFSPYSVGNLADTANVNYKLINRNFKQAHSAEKKLSHRQFVLAQQFNQYSSAQKITQQKELYLEMHQFKSDILFSFTSQLEKIITQIKIDSRFQLAFHLLHKTTHCENRICYSLPAFSHHNDKIQLSVQQSKLVLSPALYISCTLLANRRTSIFSHQIAVNRHGILHFQNSVLPSVHTKDLLNPNIVDIQSREIGKNDLIAGILFPIYSDSKVSFQCDIGQTIKIDEFLTHCDQRSLHFVDFPRKISVNGQDILPGFKPHYFVNQKLKGNENALQTKISFISDKNTTNDLTDNVFAFFEQATPVQWSLITISIILFVTFIIICFSSVILKSHYFV